MPSVKDILFGTKDKVKKESLLNPNQQQLMDLIYQGLTSGEGPLKDLFGSFNQQAFEKGVNEPALKNFQERILPMIQEKYIAGNQVGGSGMRNEQLKAGTDLQSQLAQLLYQAQQQQGQNRFAGLNTALGTRGFENIYKQGTQGALSGLLQGLAPSVGKLAGAAIAG